MNIDQLTRPGIEKAPLLQLHQNAGVRGVTLHGIDEGVYVVVDTVGGERELQTKRGQRRVFKRLDTVTEFLRDTLGVVQVGLVFDRVDSQSRAQQA